MTSGQLSAFSVLLAIAFAAVAYAGDPPTPPRGQNIGVVVIAQVQGKDGSVVRPLLPQDAGTKTVKVEVTESGKKQVMEVQEPVLKLAPIDVTVDGKVVRAFGTDRKPLSPEDLARRLKKAEPALMIGIHGWNPSESWGDPNDFLDPYYLQIVRPETVVFIGPAVKLWPPRPERPTPKGAPVQKKET